MIWICRGEQLGRSEQPKSRLWITSVQTIRSLCWDGVRGRSHVGASFHCSPGVLPEAQMVVVVELVVVVVEAA
ncbi:unnamed protein product [Arctogadus glacialis]